ncbi:hypothetical protein [Paenibacillus flagellatus]|uniref:Lipoprotein n=1 Tax=Paenibacillus flagellatus TaxID=2211139 RepID=A0A2V5KU98_9BACL|nr:hypothetical protein [Paenibacillus flagellatus]PYI55427.1 hypothetical protein DLM86_06745 [Paenibacillus flagellatus]
MRNPILVLLCFLLLLPITAGCGDDDRGVRTETLDPAEKAEASGIVAGMVGRTPDFQSNRAIAEWTPDGRAAIQRLMDDVLPTLAVSGKLTDGDAKSIGDHVYARYGDNEFVLYVPVQRKNPERSMIAQIGGGWYAVTGGRGPVDRLLEWAASQSILKNR